MNEATEIRTRIAPSPSGFLHVGTARTAIINWLYARSTGGKFILRIEDTDADRSSGEMVTAIIDSMKWLGLNWDEGPYFQSERGELYQKYLKQLLDSGNGYRCFCKADDLNAKREEARANKKNYRYDRTCLQLSSDEVAQRVTNGDKNVIRLKLPEGETIYDDMVYGEMKRQNVDMDDFVVCRNDGRPLYNFVVVVDDHEMKITDVLRGNDHQTNTFKQVLIYSALDLTPPRFGHMPLIFDERKKKISKRDKAANASDYAKEGFLPEAVVNYLTLLGWSAKDDSEIFSVKDLIKVFTISGIGKANAVFDPVKMRYVNGEHIKMQSNHDLATLLAPMLVEANVYTKYGLETRWKYLMDVVGLLKSRCQTLEEFVDRSAYYFEQPRQYEEKGMSKHFDIASAERLTQLAERFENADKFDAATIETTLKEMATASDLKLGVLIHPTRLAVSGMTTGPGLWDMLEVIGQEETIKRMRQAVIFINNRKQDD